ncbi:DUF4142 domain-containing protein [Pseudohongiella sp. SYSU M77423]|uniref:DUF4142 domain-containing protein n=1 Tax=Pseudohongiella sp. SYSU M77423 TaxID=3042312 RepID=UPI00248143B1|nr:DUF4142 domain-containing protein [Pseudohongiella sp. SYSU M77423]MDH7944974.1 DUF4142 domain-containing protein [Pseudohongiella sp. SYSU M77423]
MSHLVWFFISPSEFVAAASASHIAQVAAANAALQDCSSEIRTYASEMSEGFAEINAELGAIADEYDLQMTDALYPQQVTGS